MEDGGGYWANTESLKHTGYWYMHSVYVITVRLLNYTTGMLLQQKKIMQRVTSTIAGNMGSMHTRMRTTCQIQDLVMYVRG